MDTVNDRDLKSMAAEVSDLRGASSAIRRTAASEPPVGRQTPERQLHLRMARVPLRLLGLFLLILAISIPSCQALFLTEAMTEPQVFDPGFGRR
jgi:hypothetical protein